MENLVEIKIPKKSIKFSIDGEAVVMQLPTIGETQAFREKMNASENNEYALVLEDFLVLKGLSKEMMAKMQDNQIVEVANILTGQKKI